MIFSIRGTVVSTENFPKATTIVTHLKKRSTASLPSSLAKKRSKRTAKRLMTTTKKNKTLKSQVSHQDEEAVVILGRSKVDHLLANFTDTLNSL